VPDLRRDVAEQGSGCQRQGACGSGAPSPRASAVLVALLSLGGVVVLESARNIGETCTVGRPERELPVALPPPRNSCVATLEEELALTSTVGAKVGARRPESVR
jgi:hypothetical protein